MTGNAITIILAAIYFIVILSVGFFAGKKSNDMKQFMVSGQSLGVWVTSFGIMAAVMSGWTWMGGPGTAYAVGYVYFVQFLSCGAIGVVIGYFMLAKPVRIISSRTRCYTLPDIIAVRWNNNRTVRILSAFIILVASTTYLVSQWAATGLIMQPVLNVSYPAAVIIGAVIISLYVIAGGMLASMWTSFIQMVIMFIVAIFLVFKVVGAAGGFVPMNNAVAAINPNYIRPWWENGTFIITYVLSYSILTTGIAYGGQPSVNTKFIMLKDTKTLRWSPLVTTIAHIVGTSTFLVGIAGIVLVNNGTVPAPEKADQILPVVINTIFSPAGRAIVLVSVLAAIMSTASTYLFSTGTAIINDLLIHSFNVKLSEKKQLFWTRVTMALIVVLTVVISLKPLKMVSLIGAQAFGAFCAGFGPVLYLGMRWKRVTHQGAIAGMAVGLCIGGILPIINTAFFKGALMSGWTIGGIGTLLAYIATIIVTLMTEPEHFPVFEKNSTMDKVN